MKDLTENNFGVIIAFLLPGFVLLYGLSFSSNEVALWLAKSSDKDSLTIGGFLYATLGSLALGLIASSARWLIIDTVLKWTGVRNPGLNYERLKDRDTLAAFSAVVANHLRYYQYYANTLIALAGAFTVYLVNHNGHVGWKLWAGFSGTAILLFLASRDARKKYFARAEKILKAGDRDDERLGHQGKTTKTSE